MAVQSSTATGQSQFRIHLEFVCAHSIGQQLLVMSRQDESAGTEVRCAICGTIAHCYTRNTIKSRLPVGQITSCTVVRKWECRSEPESPHCLLL